MITNIETVEKATFDRTQMVGRKSDLSLAFFPVGLASISKLTPLSERAMATGVIISIGLILEWGLPHFLKVKWEAI